MPRLDIETRRRVIFLSRSGYSVSQIKKRLKQENINISLAALYNLLKKYNETGKLIDLPRRTRPIKLNNVMRAFINQALSENDELTTRQARNLLTQQWPTLQVSLPTIKQIRQKIGWVCTKPHYCQLIRDVGYVNNIIDRCYSVFNM